MPDSSFLPSFLPAFLPSFSTRTPSPSVTIARRKNIGTKERRNLPILDAGLFVLTFFPSCVPSFFLQLRPMPATYAVATAASCSRVAGLRDVKETICLQAFPAKRIRGCLAPNRIGRSRRARWRCLFRHSLPLHTTGASVTTPTQGPKSHGAIIPFSPGAIQYVQIPISHRFPANMSPASAVPTFS